MAASIRKTAATAGKALGGRPTNAQRQRKALESGNTPAPKISAPGKIDLSTPEGLERAVNELYAAAHHAAIYDPKAIAGAVSLLRLAADLQARDSGTALTGKFERLAELLS